MNFKYLCSAKMLVWLKAKKDENQLSESTAHLTCGKDSKVHMNGN